MRGRPEDYDAFEDGFLRGFYSALHKKCIEKGIPPGPACKPELEEKIKKQAQIEFQF